MLRSRIYYALKKIIPRKTQIQLRSFLINWTQRLNTGKWPIDKNAGTPPEGWSGWPDGKKFALVLTHDVETVNGLDKCYQLAKIEERLGFRSCFNFVIQDYQTSLKLRQHLIDHGFEIGIHGLTHAHSPFISEPIFKQQSIVINRTLKEWGSVGFRSPSMYHNLELLHYLDIEYDSSTFDTDPFEPQPDGMGTIFPFWVPDKDGKSGYIELPYTLPQDFLLFILMKKKNIELWKTKLNWIADHGGMALSITHPDYMNFDQNYNFHEYSASYYEEFLNHIKLKYENQYWNGLPKEVARWCMTQSRKKIYNLRKEKPPTRICMPVYSFYESDNRVMRYAETLARRGNNIDVIALRKDGQSFHDELRGVNVYRIQKRKKDEKGKFSYLYRILKFIIHSSVLIAWRHIKKPYQMIHVHNMPDFIVFIAFIPKLLGAKVILDIHDVTPELYVTKFNLTKNNLLFKFLLFVEKISCTFADHVIIANHLWYELIVSRSVKRVKCSVVMNYPDENVFFRRPRSRHDEKFIMIYPGSLNLRQGVDIAIKAFAIISDKLPSAEFHIYGEGGDIEVLKNLVTGFGLEKKILFKGNLPIYEVANAMANSDVGIEPKKNDLFSGYAMSTKILEFMSLGVPVIVSDTTIHKYYFNDSNVQFFKSGNEHDLARCMLLLIENDTLRHGMIINNSNFIQDYLWDKKKEEYLQLIDEFVS